MDDEEMQRLYEWVDTVPLSRPKRNIARDFADGVLLAEIVKHYHPKLVELHNYSAAHSTQQKLYNWNTLNQKVLKRLGLQIAKGDIEDVAACKPGAVERVLRSLQPRLSSRPPPDQSQPRKAPAPHQGPPQQDLPVTGQANYPPTNVGRPAPRSHTEHHSLLQKDVDTEILVEKEQTIQELKETIEILEVKIKKLEQLVRLKDSKIQSLTGKLQQAGML